MGLLAIYWDCLRKVGPPLMRAPWVLFVPSVIAALLGFAGLLLLPLGMLGGFILGFLGTIALAAQLQLVSDLVDGRRLTPSDLTTGFQRILSPVMGVLFVVWVANLLARPILGNMPNGNALWMSLQAVLFVLLNATPEVITRGRSSSEGLVTFASSASFIQEHWLVWFPPNLLAVGAAWLAHQAISSAAAQLGGLLGTVIAAAATGLLVLPVLAFRALLFDRLDGRVTGFGRRR